MCLLCKDEVLLLGRWYKLRMVLEILPYGRRSTLLPSDDEELRKMRVVDRVVAAQARGRHVTTTSGEEEAAKPKGSERGFQHCYGSVAKRRESRLQDSEGGKKQDKE